MTTHRDLHRGCLGGARRDDGKGDGLGGTPVDAVGLGFLLDPVLGRAVAAFVTALATVFVTALGAVSVTALDVGDIEALVRTGRSGCRFRAR